MDNNPVAVGVPDKPSSPSHRESSSKREKKESEEDHSRSKRSSRRDRGDEEDRDARAKRREKEDRDAKRKARSSDDTSSSTPGAHASSGDHKSSRKSGRGSTADDPKDRPSRSSRSPKRDEKAAYRSTRSDGSASTPGARAERSSQRDEKAAYRSNRSGSASVPGAQSEIDDSNRSSRSRQTDEKAAYRSNRSGSASVPGAQAEKSSSRQNDEKAAYRSNRSGAASTPGARSEKSSSKTSKNADEKGKERRPNRATRPGAESATSSQDKIKAKIDGNEFDINVAANDDLPKSGKEEETVIAAMIVEDDEEEKEDEDAKRRREQARIQEILAAERRQMQAEQQRIQEENEREDAERKEKERKAKKRNMVICVVILLLIGGGVAAAFAVGGGGSSTPVTDGKITSSPSADNSSSPSFNPTDTPSISPSALQLKYEKPDSRDCERLAAGLTIDREDTMFDRSFEIPLEVILVPGYDIGTLLSELQTAIEKRLVSDLIGCPRELFANKRRGLGQYPNSDNQVYHQANASSPPHRLLQSVKSIRYAIAKATVNVIVTVDACKSSSSPNCSMVAVGLDLKVKGEEKIGLLSGVILEVFPSGQDIRPDLELIAPFDTIIVGIMRSLDPTQAPTMAPTSIATENPTVSLTNSATRRPTKAPVILPTIAPVVGPNAPDPTQPPTSSPTKPPSKAPTKAPTPPPTLAPTSTPPPTAAPQPGVTPIPTSSPSKTPTNIPSQSPSHSPSTKPSVAPSAAPSTKPSVVASSSPTIRATLPPTPGPTFRATPSPTSWPTADTTGLVSLLNSQMWMDLTSTYVGAYSHPAINALDGNLDTFAHTNLSNFNRWRVFVRDYYKHSVNVNKVIIWNRRDCCPERLEGAVVRLYGVGSGNLLATSAPLTSALVQSVDFGEIVGVQWVEVHHESGSNYLAIAEIEAWGSIPTGPRLGFVPLLRREGMGTDQSSTFNSVDYATYALDGNLESYSHTLNGGNEWWRTRVQDYYGQLVNVKQVTVWNRIQCCQERLEGAVIRLYGGGVGNLLVTSAPLTSAMVQTVDFGEVVGVQYVQVHHLTQQQYVTIGEIEAWGTVPNDPSNLGYKGLLKDGMNPDQSSSWDSSSTGPNNALNGNYDDFVHTLNSGAEWWRVNVENYYGQLVTVNKVTVWNRRDELVAQRLEGAVIKLYGAGSDNLLLTSAPLTGALVQTVDLGEVTGVAWVQIHQESRPEYLHFAEIEAWGKVP